MKLQATFALLVAGVVSVGAAATVHAADLPTYSSPTSVDVALDYAVPKSNRWTGFYVGGNIGAGFVTNNGNDRDIAGGVQIGYNQQFDHFVVGGEFEGIYTNRLQYQIGAGGLLEQTWNGTAKARAGVAFDNILLFGALGVNLARLEGKGTVTSGDRWQAGVAFGGGVEVAFTEQLSGKLEYTQTRFNGVESTIAGIGRKDDLVNHAIKAGVNFRF
ncbi:outer membrane protein [Devosia sp. LjRoot3]|uniref:outer membrane protein n=1 Tax=Devosia sp. LjRoot3 TaxID=3342319 RepID=UPI003ED07BCF